MFFRVWKQKKLADAVLGEVAPLLGDAARFGVAPARLAADKYLLGFFCGNIVLAMQRAGATPLDTITKGAALLLVLHHLFGRNAIDDKEVGDLLNGVPQPNRDFVRGSEAAAKIYYASTGRHRLHDDPDYLAAKAVVRRARASLDLITSGATEDSKIAGEMLRALYYQHMIDRHQRQADAAP